MVSDWLPAATLAAGVVGTLGGQGLREWFTWKREESARTAEREVARGAFQRDTLLEIQDVVVRLLVNTLESLVHRGRVFEETGRWGRDLYPDELSKATGAVMADMSRLRQRILNDDLRRRLLVVQDLVTEINRPPLQAAHDDAAKQQAFDTFVRQLLPANAALEDHLGEVLRALL